MNLAGQRVLFRLSEAGRDALRGLVPESGSFERFVVDENSLGVWILVLEEPKVTDEEADRVMLVKWEHFSTATLRPGTPVEKRPIGFRARER